MGIDVMTRTAERVRQDIPALGRILDKFAARFKGGDPGDGKSGRCCYCGTEKPEESPCPASPDDIHCNHWWDGPETPEKKSSTGSAGTEGEDRPRGDWNEVEAFTAARRLMRERLEQDEGLRIGYRSNIAMLLDDELDLGHDKRNELAERLIKLIFGEG